MPTLRRCAILIASALALAGCVTMTEPVTAGTNTYMLGLNAKGGMTGDAELLAQTMRAAGAFCERQGRHIELQSSSTSGTQGWTPQSNSVVFRCLG